MEGLVDCKIHDFFIYLYIYIYIFFFMLKILTHDITNNWICYCNYSVFFFFAWSHSVACWWVLSVACIHTNLIDHKECKPGSFLLGEVLLIFVLVPRPAVSVYKRELINCYYNNQNKSKMREKAADSQWKPFEKENAALQVLL